MARSRRTVTYLASIGIEDGPIEGESEETKTIYDSYWDRATKCIEGPWKAEDYPVIQDRIEYNRKPFDLLIAASKYDKFWMPAYPNPIASENPTLFSADLSSSFALRDIDPCLIYRAMARLEEGDFETCQDDMIVVRRLARLVTQNCFETQGRIGISASRFAMFPESRLLFHGTLNVKQIGRYESAIQNLPDQGTYPEMIRIEERLASLSELQNMHVEDSSFDINTAMRSINIFCDRLAESVGNSPDPEAKLWIAEFHSASLTPPTKTGATLSPVPKRKLTQFRASCSQ